MAEKQGKTEVLNEVKETLECCICTDIFTDPRMLPCMHTFCLDCIQQTGLSSDKQPGDKMLCPVCRKKFKVPRDGFIGLQKNFFIERLLGIFSASERAETFCGVCSGDIGEATKKPLASVYCVECWENFCEKCHDDHKASRTFGNHQMVDVGSQSHREALLRDEASAVNYCGIHDNVRLSFFCFDCRKVSCEMCAATEHLGHNCVHNVKALAQFEKEIDDEVKELSVWTKKVLDRRQLLKQEIAAYSSNAEQVEKGILDRYAELQHVLELNTAALLEELNTAKVKKLQELENEDEMLEGNLKVLSSFNVFCRDLKFSAFEAVPIVESLRQRANELKKQTHVETSSQRLLLKKSDFKGALDGNPNVIGQLENFAITVKGSMDTVNHSLYGIARLQDDIFALSQFPHSVLIFEDKSPFTLKQSISLMNLQEPRDMAACHVTNCLYVADAGNSSVWKVSIGDNQDVNCWLSEEKYIAALSVSSLGQVAVVRKGQGCSLTIYRDDTTVIHCVPLLGELSNALHAVQKSNGNFVISFGVGLKCGVCEITGSGNIVHKLNVDDEAQRVKYPSHLACALDDRILVADFYNNRVVLLDSELKFSMEILSKHSELSFPWRICYDESCNQLLVVHGGRKVSCGRTKIAMYEVYAIPTGHTKLNQNSYAYKLAF